MPTPPPHPTPARATTNICLGDKPPLFISNRKKCPSSHRFSNELAISISRFDKQFCLFQYNQIENCKNVKPKGTIHIILSDTPFQGGHARFKMEPLSKNLNKVLLYY